MKNLTKITKKQSELHRYLMVNKGKLVTPEQIKKDTSIVNIVGYVCAINKLLKTEKIINVHGKGYMIQNKMVTSGVINDTLYITWNTFDVIERASHSDVTLTNEQALLVLNKLDRNHDCEYGITWHHIDAAIADIIDEII